MALGSALTDRARRVYEEPSGPRVAGRTATRPVKGAWFKARLFAAAGERENNPPVNVGNAGWAGPKRSMMRPQLLFAVKDSEGEPLHPRADEHFIVSSNQHDALGLPRELQYRIVAEPQIIRKKRAVIGFLATLERVIERERREP